MRKLLFILSLLLFVVACDDMTVVSRVPAGSPRQVTSNVSCTYAGLCQACEYRIDKGKTKCWLGFHQSCDGHRDAIVNLQDFTVKYKSGRVDTETTSTTANFLSDCK